MYSDPDILAAEAQPRHAADPRHGEGGALEENVAAAGIKLSDEEFRTLDEQGRKAV